MRKQADEPDAAAVDPWDSLYLDGPGQGGAVRVRLPGDAPLLRVRAGQGGRAGPDRAPLRGHLRAAPRPRRCGTPTWRPTTSLEGERLLGRIFLDMHPRADKYNHAAMFTLVNGKAGVRVPECVLVCNLPRPGRGAGAAAALRGEHVLPRVRAPDPPHLRRAHPVGRTLRDHHRVGLRGGALAAARGVDAGRADAGRVSRCITRRASRCPPSSWRSCARPRSTARGCSSGSRCSTPR